MATRLTGLGLVLLGVLFAVLFLYLPIRDGSNGFMGPVRVKALVFVPLAVVTGFAFLIGGPRVLAAFQAGTTAGGAKTKQQTALVLSIIVGSGVLTGIGYWQIKTRWLRAPEPVILEVPPMPQMPPIQQPTIPRPPSPNGR